MMSNGQMSQPQQIGVSPTQQFTIVLEAQQWNAVLGALAEAPYRISAPLIQAIGQQLQQQAPAGTMGADAQPMPQPN